MTEPSLLKKIADNFTELSERERRVMKERFGIDLIKLPSLEEVGRAFDKAREKIREFERRTTRTERKPPGNDEGGPSPAASTTAPD